MNKEHTATACHLAIYYIFWSELLFYQTVKQYSVTMRCHTLQQSGHVSK